MQRFSQTSSSTVARAFRAACCRHTNSPLHSSASDKLFADAAREEAEASHRPRAPSRIPELESRHGNWDGDEKIQDAVLRMLIDKYKPLRTGTIQSAEHKLKQSPPHVLRPSTGSWTTEPLLPSVQGHQPWHTEFKAPLYKAPLVKQALISQASVSKPLSESFRERRKERDDRKRSAEIGRLVRARESTLDYRLGIKVSGSGGHLNSVTLKRWSNVVEDKILRAQETGLFQNVTGRGKPLAQHVEDSNPFIAREEFLMNRIVQRNGALPPWVEIQNELNQSVAGFRQILHQAWIRQAIRTITSSTPISHIPTLTLNDIKAFRDLDWQRRERGYHEVLLEEANSLVRKYNSLTPYSLRRPYYVLDVEYNKLFDICAAEIMEELHKRRQDDIVLSRRDKPATKGEHRTTPFNQWSLADLIRIWLRSLTTKLWPK